MSEEKTEESVEMEMGGWLDDEAASELDPIRMKAGDFAPGPVGPLTVKGFRQVVYKKDDGNETDLAMFFDETADYISVNFTNRKKLSTLFGGITASQGKQVFLDIVDTNYGKGFLIRAA